MGGECPAELLFLLPYNDEQMEIVRRLEDRATAGAVVQRPPGTGKTHTIANIICHYMATGRRVLVSARTPEALSAVQHKLPKSIRDLAIAVIHSDRAGGRQLELAVDVLASQVKQIDVRDYNDRRVAAERRLAEVRRSVAEIDGRTREHAEANLSPTEYRGERLVPMDLAARVGAERAAHAWFPDELGLDARFAPRFDDAGIDEARAARAAFGSDLVYGPDAFLRVSDLPDVPGLLVAHQALVADRRSAGAAQAGDLPALSTAAATDAAALPALHDGLIALAEWHEEVGAAAP